GKGLELLKTPEKVVEYVHDELAKRDEKKPKKSEVNITPEAQLTPEESLYDSFEGIKSSIYAEIISTINSKAPKEFEKLVVMLLQKMGYGGEVHNSGEVTKQSNDGGIDGIIKEDVLGLGRIYIQAKRYAEGNSVGREDIQKFVGALAVSQSNKGVFITTSYYAKTAIDYCNSLSATTNIVLIDGKKLAELMYEYGLGMQTEKTIEIKKLDSDFWDAMMDE
ncbi:MAG: restriction endonuclease, partial [Cytophagales bacterium]